MIIIIAMLFLVLTCVSLFIALLISYKANKLKVHFKVTLPLRISVDMTAEMEQSKQPELSAKLQRHEQAERIARSKKYKKFKESLIKAHHKCKCNKN